MKLFNTESRTKEAVPKGKIRMYTCGPTIYNFAHIGNFRTYVFEDLLRRTLKFMGREVEQAMNLTDIDDKTIRGAIQNNVTLKEFTDPFKKAFFEDLKTLNIEPAEHYPEATAYIPQMIEMIQTMLKKGIAYQTDTGSVYYAIRKFPSYGKLSHFTLSDLEANASGENEADEYTKDNISDFALWKSYDETRDGQIFWESPFGKGRPGWHIECSAMATAIFGPTLDIHCGGIDNMFPHHENEIAQSECCTGKQFVKIWCHSEHLLVEHKKMSKSLGNFYTLRDILDKGYTGRELRYLLLSSHYRMQLNFTFEGLSGARASLSRIDAIIARLKTIETAHKPAGLIEPARERFQSGLSDDLNTAVSLAALFDFIRELNVLADAHKLGYEEAQSALKLFADWDRVLGLDLFKEEEISADLLEFLRRREEARRAKNWAVSDQMRDALLSRGYLIEDTPQGARLKKR